MLLVLCVDLDDDLGRKAEVETPVVGRDAVEEAAVALATTDPEDSDVNVLFEGVHVHDRVAATDEPVAVAAVAGTEAGDVTANRKVGDEVDQVLARLDASEPVRAVVVSDGAQDESVLPVVRSRVTVDGVRRVVVRQAEDLESMYYTIKQVLDDPETRGTILVPLGILLLVYPFAVLADVVGVQGSAVLGLTSALLGLYALFRGLGLEGTVDRAVARVSNGLYAGRVTLITYVVAAALLVIGGVEAVDRLEAVRQSGDPGGGAVLAALVYGSVTWFAAAGLTSSLGQITDEYLAGRFEWRYLNAPFYIVAIAAVLQAVSGYFLGQASLSHLAAMLTAGTLLGVVSTLAFAVVEQHRASAV
jgi:putative membrane protein